MNQDQYRVVSVKDIDSVRGEVLDGGHFTLLLLMSELFVLTDETIIATTRTKHNPGISDPHHTKP